MKKAFAFIMLCAQAALVFSQSKTLFKGETLNIEFVFSAPSYLTANITNIYTKYKVQFLFEKAVANIFDIKVKTESYSGYHRIGTAQFNSVEFQIIIADCLDSQSDTSFVWSQWALNTALDCAQFIADCMDYTYPLPIATWSSKRCLPPTEFHIPIPWIPNDEYVPPQSNNIYVPLPPSVIALDTNDFTCITSSSGIVIIGLTGFANAVIIPPQINGKPVTGIGESAFYEKRLFSVNIPLGVTSIGNWAFGSNWLSSVIISNGVIAISEGAFCDNLLTGVIIPAGVISIGQYAFASNQLISVTIPRNVSIAVDTFDEDFFACYNNNRKQAGTYVYNNGV